MTNLGGPNHCVEGYVGNGERAVVQNIGCRIREFDVGVSEKDSLESRCISSRGVSSRERKRKQSGRSLAHLITKLSSISIAPLFKSVANTGGMLRRMSVLTRRNGESICASFVEVCCSACFAAFLEDFACAMMGYAGVGDGMYYRNTRQSSQLTNAHEPVGWNKITVT
jgi:hypothetical protein